MCFKDLKTHLHVSIASNSNYFQQAKINGENNWAVVVCA